MNPIRSHLPHRTQRENVLSQNLILTIACPFIENAGSIPLAVLHQYAALAFAGLANS